MAMQDGYKPIRKLKDVTDEEIEIGIRHARSWRDAARRLGINDTSVSKSAFSRRVKALGYSTEHFRYEGHAIKLEALLVKDGPKTFQASELLEKLVEAGLMKNECALCGQGPEWQGKRLPMRLNAINGFTNDRRLENLRALCPNCYSQNFFVATPRKIAKISRIKLKSYEELAKEEGLLR